MFSNQSSSQFVSFTKDFQILVPGWLKKTVLKGRDVKTIMQHWNIRGLTLEGTRLHVFSCEVWTPLPHRVKEMKTNLIPLKAQHQGALAHMAQVICTSVNAQIMG